jgi:hypothetical protein
MAGVRRVGSVPGRQLYAGSDLTDWPADLKEPFVAVTALDARERSDEQLRDLARVLLDRGCVYACAWGPDAGRVEVAFDLVSIEAEDAGRPYVSDVVMTTAHENEALDEALWFAVYTAFAAEVEVGAVVAVSDETWIREVEARLADPGQLMEDVLARDDGDES